MTDGIKNAGKGNFSYDVGSYKITPSADGSATVEGPKGAGRHFIAELKAVEWARKMMLKGIVAAN